VQNRYNFRERTADDTLDYCERNGIAFLPFGPLGAQPFERNAPLTSGTGVLGEIAARLGATPAQVALAWLLHRSPNVIVIPGTTAISHLEENIAAARISLGADDLSALAAAKSE
jgi:aryl-alcohol dehydrogenase-like predicted oxidoreductase